MIEQVLDTYAGNVRRGFKHYPLAFHADAPLAHKAALAAEAQGKFWDMHDLLFAQPRNLKKDQLVAYADQIQSSDSGYCSCLMGVYGVEIH